MLSEDTNIKVNLAKYGLFDVTFQHQTSQQLLKIYCQAAETGYLPQLEAAGKKFDMDEMRGYVRGYLEDIDRFFPLRAQIIDCCLTTDPGVWDDKYFYS